MKAHTELVHAVAVSPDGKLLATGGFDNTIKIWEIAPDGSLKEKTVLKGHTGPVYAVAFHPTEADARLGQPGQDGARLEPG